MARRRAFIPQKLPVFLAGEGASEQGYGRWLNRLAAAHKIPVAIKAESLTGGDPLGLVEGAMKNLATAERHGRRYAIRGLLLDTDQFGKSKISDT